MKTGNCWRLEETEVFVHVPFLKNSSDKYLKRVFKTDFGLNLSDNNINSLRNPKSDTVKISSLEQQ
jgi:hypothetical protein